MARVTVVNDNREFLDVVAAILESDRYEATLIKGAAEDALEQIRASRPDVLMIDLRLGSDGLHGWGIAQQVRRDPALEGTPILLCSADNFALREIEDQLDDRYTVVTLKKPFSIDELLGRVDDLLRRRQPLDLGQRGV